MNGHRTNLIWLSVRHYSVVVIIALSGTHILYRLIVGGLMNETLERIRNEAFET
jgi:hypothetical protein